MKFKDISERVKGGKLDPLSKMGKSKLTGQEVARYYRENPKAKQAAKNPDIKKAIELALDLGGNYTLAYKEIQKINRNLPRHPEVKKALQTANESVNEISEADFRGHFATYHTPNQKKSMKDFIALAKKMSGVSNVTSEKQKNSRGQPIFRTSYITDKRTADKLEKQQSALEKKYKEESVNEGVSVSDERIVNKGKSIIIMIDDNGKKVSAIFKDKKNADKFNRNKPSDVKKLLKLAKSKKYPKAIDENEMTSTSSVAMPEIPLGKVRKRKDLEEGKVENKKAQIEGIKLMRRVKATTKGHKIAIEDLMQMTSPKVLEKMFKQNPRGFMTMLQKMNPKRDKLSKADYMVDGQFVSDRGILSKDQTKRLEIDIKKLKENKVDESTELNEDTMTYRVKGMQKPEMDKFTSSAKLMKLKMQVKRSPRGNETLITMSGNKKQLRDFDAVARGKSSYGDPSLIEDAVERAKEMADLKAKHKREVEQEKDEIERTKQSAETESVLAQLDALEEQIDLLEKQFALKPGQDGLERKIRTKYQKSRSGRFMDKKDVLAMLKKKKDGKHKIKDPNTSLIVRSLARIMNQERRPAAKKGVAFGKGEGPDEMNAPELKKIIDMLSKGMTITKTGDKIMRDPKELALFNGLDTAIRDDVYEVILQASNGLIFSLIYEGYKSGTPLNEESAVMKKVRQVVKKKSMMNIDGMKLDLTTASMISSVYDQVNPQNKKRMDKLKLPQLINLTMKVAGKSRKESTDLQEVTRQEVDAMKKVSKDMQKVLQTYQKIATIGDKELKDTRHNKDYKKVLDARDSILKMIGTLNTKMLMQKETVSEANQSKKFQMTFTDKQPKSLDHFLRMIKTQEKATAKAGLTTIKLLKKTKKGKNTVVDFMAGPNMQIDSIKRIMTNVKKKFKEGLEEAVSPAQQAAIAISKKERGEKPKNECADEKDFKPHKMYKGDKEVMANTYADHMKFGKMGYTHEKPKSEALDAKDKPFVKDLVKKLRGGSKTHAKQADDLEKAINTESMSRARADAMRDMDRPKDRGDDDGYGVATKDDRKAADKNVVMQIRRVTDLSKPAQIELRNGKKVMLKPADAKMMMKKFDAIRKPQDRLKVQNAMNDKKMTVQGLKRLLGR